MPSVTDVQQPSLSSNNNGKSTPPPSTTSNDSTNADPIIQAILVLEKKQRNLGKRKVNFRNKNHRFLTIYSLGKIGKL